MLVTIRDGRLAGAVPDGTYEMERIDSLRRTERQNRFLWGVVYPQIVRKLSDKGECFSEEDVHTHFKFKFIKRKRIKDKFTKRYKLGEPSTAKLDKKDFTAYVKKLDEYCIQTFGEGMDLRDGRDLLYWQEYFGTQ